MVVREIRTMIIIEAYTILFFAKKIFLKDLGKWVLMTLLYNRCQEGSLTLTVKYNGCVKFEINNTKSSYTKNSSEQRHFAESFNHLSPYITKYIL